MGDGKLVTGEELFRLYEQYRRRDQATLMRARRDYQLRQALVFVFGVALGGALTTVTFFSTGG